MAAMDEGKMDVVVQVKREQGKKDDPLKMHTDLPASVTCKQLLERIVNNYSPKWRWLAVDIYRAAKRRGKYPTLATDTEVNSCFSIH